MKSFLSLLLASIIAVSFVACGGSDSEGNSTGDASNSDITTNDTTQNEETTGSESIIETQESLASEDSTDIEEGTEATEPESEETPENNVSDTEFPGTSGDSSTDAQTTPPGSGNTASGTTGSSSGKETNSGSNSGYGTSTTTKKPIGTTAPATSKTPSTSVSTSTSANTTTNGGSSGTSTGNSIGTEPVVEPAPSYPLMNTKTPSSRGEYNTPNVSASAIREGAGPLTSHNIYVGKNEFMFLGETIEDYTGDNLWNDRKLERLASNLNERDEWTKENGIKLYFVICPNKATIYGDYVPSSLIAASNTRLNQVVAYLEDNSTIEVIDVSSALKSARSTYGDSLYYKYDTHWTQDGGFVAYTEIMKHISGDFSNAVTYSKNNFNINYYETYLKDMPYYLGYYSNYTDKGAVYSLKEGPDAELISRIGSSAHGQYVFAYQWPNGYRDDLRNFTFQSKNTSAPSLYMYRDSFAMSLVPFFKESFSESTYNWDYNFSRTEILESGADVVIIQVVEKYLDDILKTKTFID